MTLLRLGSLALCSFVVVGEAEARELAEVQAQLRDATLYISVSYVDENPNNRCTERKQGSGTILSSDGHAVTSAHILERPSACAAFEVQEIEVRFGYRNDPTRIAVGTAIPDVVAADIALLKLSERAGGYQAAPLCSEQNISPNAELYSFGFPVDQEFQYLPAHFQNASGDAGRWIAQSDFTSGMSGGPVTNTDGKVIGIVQGGVKGTSAVRYIVPLVHAEAVLRAGGVELQSCDEERVANSPCASPAPLVELENPSDFFEPNKRNRMAFDVAGKRYMIATNDCYRVPPGLEGDLRLILNTVISNDQDLEHGYLGAVIVRNVNTVMDASKYVGALSRNRSSRSSLTEWALLRAPEVLPQIGRDDFLTEGDITVDPDGYWTDDNPALDDVKGYRARF